MKRAQLSSQCICGAKLALTVRKPKRLTPTFAKASCACGSRYLFECKLGADARSIERLLPDDFNLKIYDQLLAAV